MINLKEKNSLVTLEIERYSVRKFLCNLQFTEADLEECINQRFSDLCGGYPYRFDFEVGKIYDTIWDWKTFDDDGYMWVTILKERLNGETIITSDMILGSVYSIVMLNNFEEVTLVELREEILNRILE